MTHCNSLFITKKSVEEIQDAISKISSVKRFRCFQKATTLSQLIAFGTFTTPSSMSLNGK